jgi:hypothetical protein
VKKNLPQKRKNTKRISSDSEDEEDELSDEEEPSPEDSITEETGSLFPMRILILILRGIS